MSNAATRTCYTVGQKILAMFYVTDGRIGWINPTFRPWEQTLTKILTIVLTVTEHHQVPWDQDPNGEAKYDGFKLVAEDGTEWGNQFPKASYSQISTNANHYFSRLWPKDTDLHDKTDEELVDYEDILTVIDRVNRGIQYFSKGDMPGASNYKAQLEAHLQVLVDLVKEKLNSEVVQEVIWAEVPEITRAALKPL